MFGVIVASLLVAGIEALLRLVLPFPAGTRHTYVSDSQVLYFHRPNSRGYEESPFGDFAPTLVRYNHLGFRGDWEAPPRGKPLVAIWGDSFVEARQVSESASMTGLLARRFPSLFFVNAGCSAYTTTTEYLLLKYRLLALKPSRLILFFTFNDYADNFNYQGGYFRHPGIFDAAQPPDELRPRDYEASAERPFVEILKEHSAIVANLGRLMKAKPVAELALPMERRLFQESFRGINTPTEQLDEIGRQLLDFTHRGLSGIAHLAAEAGVPLSVFVIPLPTQVGPHEWSPGKSLYYGYPSGGFDDSVVYQTRLLSYCESAGIQCIDLLPDFRRAAYSGRKLFLPYDGHWTPEGHEVAAAAVARILQGGS